MGNNMQQYYVWLTLINLMSVVPPAKKNMHHLGIRRYPKFQWFTGPNPFITLVIVAYISHDPTITKYMIPICIIYIYLHMFFSIPIYFSYFFIVYVGLCWLSHFSIFFPGDFHGLPIFQGRSARIRPARISTGRSSCVSWAPKKSSAIATSGFARGPRGRARSEGNICFFKLLI